MKRPTQRDVRMLTDVRDRLRAELSDALPRPLTRDQERILGYQPIAASVDCNHGVPWTDCDVCSRRTASRKGQR